MIPEEGPFKPRIYFKGKWTVPNIAFAGPLYYDEGEECSACPRFISTT